FGARATEGPRQRWLAAATVHVALGAPLYRGGGRAAVVPAVGRGAAPLQLAHRAADCRRPADWRGRDLADPRRRSPRRAADRRTRDRARRGGRPRWAQRLVPRSGSRRRG